MHILMLSIGMNAFKKKSGDTLERHILYAKASGQLTMIVYNHHSEKQKPLRTSSGLTIIPTNSLNRATWLFDVLKTSLNICKLNKPDLITVQDPFGTATAGIILKNHLKVPLEIQNHSDFLDNKIWLNERPCMFRAFNGLAKYTLPQGDALRVLNTREAEKYSDLGISDEKIHILPTPVNLERFLPEPDRQKIYSLREKYSLSDNNPVAIWAGRMVKVKNLELLLSTIKKISGIYSNFRCLIVGSGELETQTRRRAIEMGLRDIAIFTGAVQHSDLSAYYRMANFYIHSSKYEGLGKVMIEAMACALPVISTPTSGAEEIVKSGYNGYLSTEHNAGELSKLADILIKNPNKTIELGKNARTFAENNYGLNRGVKDIVHLWQSMINSKS